MGLYLQLVVLFLVKEHFTGGAAIAAPFFMGGDEEEEVPEESFTETPSSIANIVDQARRQDPSLRFLPKPKFVDNFYLADGGTISNGR